MNPAWIRTFIEVYRTGSFGKAAQRLNISQPAVTQQIRALEKKLGTCLFIRNPTGSRPTPAADALASDAMGPVDALDAVVQRHFGTGGEARLLRLGAPSDLISQRILPVLANMLRDRVQLRSSPTRSDSLIDQLASGELDIVVARGRPRLKGVTALPLYDEECSLVASADTARDIPPGRIAEEGPQVLAKYPLVAFAESLPLIDHYWWSVFHVHEPTDPDVVVPDQRAVLAAVKASVGISVLPTYLCVDDLARGDLVELVEPEVPPITTAYVATRSADVSRPHVLAAQDLLLAHARSWT
ncbi:LysR family transcriptional regulator [Streptomyces sp. NPDC006879]|uniref:LysR family transcriptional regulator n=1 Tax=Streptomyces sp. NPDC006879 TaxID=3364767 RepID=UPI0036C0C308